MKFFDWLFRRNKVIKVQDRQIQPEEWSPPKNIDTKKYNYDDGTYKKRPEKTQYQFCTSCGAGVGPYRRPGEGTCPVCDPTPHKWIPITNIPKRKDEGDGVDNLILGAVVGYEIGKMLEGDHPSENCSMPAPIGGGGAEGLLGSDTPRTDAIRAPNDPAPEGTVWENLLIHARTLERELAGTTGSEHQGLV